MTHARRWTLFSTIKPRRDSISQPVYLPMNNETVIIFDNTLQSLRNLANNALLTMQIDIRCRVIYVLTKAMAGPQGPQPQPVDTPSTPAPSANTNWHLLLPTSPTAASPQVLVRQKMKVDTSATLPIGKLFRQTGLCGGSRMR